MTKSKDRIAFFLPGLYEGGAERIILKFGQGSNGTRLFG